MLTTIVFNTKLAPDIPIHPTALYYDLYSDLDWLEALSPPRIILLIHIV